MKVYVIEQFADYEGSQITRVYADRDEALLFCKEKVTEIQKDYCQDKKIEELPTGFKVGSRGVIYQEREVE